MNQQDRIRRARIAAHSLHAQGKTTTVAARESFDQRFYRQVDPEGKLPAAERERRAEHARKAYYLRLSAAGVKKRQSQR